MILDLGTRWMTAGLLKRVGTQFPLYRLRVGDRLAVFAIYCISSTTMGISDNYSFRLCSECLHYRTDYGILLACQAQVVARPTYCKILMNSRFVNNT